MRTMNGRLARRYPGTLEDVKRILHYDPRTGEMHTKDAYNIRQRRGQHGHMMIRIPISVETMDRGKRVTADFRCDHLAWFLTMEVWPSGHIEHVNDLLSDDTMDNLIHRDRDGIRWWFGSEEIGQAPRLVMVDSVSRSNGYEGPLLYEQDLGSGKVRWVPVVSEEHRLSTDGGRNLEGIEDEAYPKGEFGKDWGYIPDQQKDR